MGRAFAGMVISIYESAAEGSWAGVMGGIAARFGAHAGLIYSCDKVSRRLLAAGGRPKEIAARRGVSINTVRTQLASCMHKLNVHRQADLVRVVAQAKGCSGPSIINLSDVRRGG